MASRPADMESKRDLGELRELTELLLDPQSPAYSLRTEVLALKSILSRLGPKLAEPEQNIDFGETHTSDGIAISPTMAAMCADDHARTVQFLRGTHAAIEAARAGVRDRPVRVLYAGCGPYAMLATPLMSVLSPEDAVFTLLDIHETSIESARSILEGLGLAASVDAYVTANACAFRIDAERPPDLLLMEVMQACLQVEPQVAVARHLLPQAPQAILVPEEVRVDLRFVDPRREFDLDGGERASVIAGRDRSSGGTVFTLNRSTIEDWAGIAGARLPGTSVRIPDPYDTKRVPMLFTYIRVFGEHGLGDYDSGLTSPHALRLTHDLTAGQLLRFHYELGNDPELVCEADQPSIPD